MYYENNMEKYETLSFPEICEALEYTGWESSAIRTMITRLVKKDALNQTKKGFYLYSSNIKQDD